jgi:GalNAc-alpha-(1->4)-GalNAc-alpha-(1->3)-diNAcBac-PP-undecaprenol alpha-1,4-N-acetyl-D-galactosaminyltransferase
LRIACTIHALHSGGAERLMARLASHLAERHEVRLITWANRTPSDYPLGPNVERLTLDLQRPSRNLHQRLRRNRQRILALRSSIASFHPDVVLSFCDQMNIVALAATKPLSIPVVVSEHTNPARQPLPIAWRLARRRYYPTAANAIVLDPDYQPLVDRWLGGPRSIVIPSAIDAPTDWPTPLRIAPQPIARPRLLLAVGRLSPEKGFDRLIDAFLRSTAPQLGWQLHVIGEGPQRSALERQIADANASTAIVLRGWQSDIWNVLAGGSAMVLSSHYEGFPLALLEAMAAGLPCLSVDCPSGPRSLIEHGVNGWLVASNADAIRDGISRLTSDDALRDRLSANAIDVRKRYGLDAFVARHEAILQAND